MGGPGAGPGPPTQAGLPALGWLPARARWVWVSAGKPAGCLRATNPATPGCRWKREGEGKESTALLPHSSSPTCKKPRNCSGPIPCLLGNGVNDPHPPRSRCGNGPHPALSGTPLPHPADVCLSDLLSKGSLPPCPACPGTGRRCGEGTAERCHGGSCHHPAPSCCSV